MKKIIAVMLAAALVVSAAMLSSCSCGGEKKDDTASQTETKAEETKSEETMSEETEATQVEETAEEETAAQEAEDEEEATEKTAPAPDPEKTPIDGEASDDDKSEDSDELVDRSVAVAQVKSIAGSGATILSCKQGKTSDGRKAWVIEVEPITASEEVVTDTYYVGNGFLEKAE